MPRSYITTSLFLMAALAAPSKTLLGQSGPWNASNNAKSKGIKKTGETRNRFKDYKQHLQNWGMDTSYKKAFLLGGRLNTDGWSGGMYFVKKKKYRDRIWQVHFSEIKHEKQTKQKGANKSFPELGNPTPYVYGKINNLYTLQVGYGRERLLLPGVLDGNISVAWRYNTGISLAMLKPYYLKMMQVDYTTTPPKASIVEDRYTQADSAQFLNEKLILGASTWTKSLNKINYVPGAYFETAIAIMPGKTKTFIQVITLGCNAALYYKPLPIMQGQKSYPYNINLFAGIGLGKRW